MITDLEKLQGISSRYSWMKKITVERAFDEARSTFSMRVAIWLAPDEHRRDDDVLLVDFSDVFGLRFPTQDFTFEKGFTLIIEATKDGRWPDANYCVYDFEDELLRFYCKDISADFLSA